MHMILGLNLPRLYSLHRLYAIKNRCEIDETKHALTPQHQTVTSYSLAHLSFVVMKVADFPSAVQAINLAFNLCIQRTASDI